MVIFTGQNIQPVLGTIVPLLAPLGQTEKGGARRCGLKVKNNGTVAVVREKNGPNSCHFRAIFELNFVKKS